MGRKPRAAPGDRGLVHRRDLTILPRSSVSSRHLLSCRALRYARRSHAWRGSVCRVISRSGPTESRSAGTAHRLIGSGRRPDIEPRQGSGSQLSLRLLPKAVVPDDALNDTSQAHPIVSTSRHDASDRGGMRAPRSPVALEARLREMAQAASGCGALWAHRLWAGDYRPSANRSRDRRNVAAAAASLHTTHRER